MAVKKKAVAKKAAPKKTTAKKVAKKSVAKKTTAKKTTAKKVAKKSAPKKVAKKATAKKAVAKKAVAKKAVAKKATVKKAAAKKTVKKSPARKSSASSVVIPPVPTGASRDRVNVSTTPVAPVKSPATATKPSAAPRQGSSKSVLVAVLLGVAILTAIVASQQSSNDSTKTDTPAATATESASPEATATESASPAASTDTTNAATTGEAPTRFIGNWKDASTKEVLVLSWKAPAGDVTGYKVEIAPNGGAWKEVSQIPSSELKFELTKTSDSQYTSFRVSAIYSDGSLGVAKAFGFAGQYE